MPAIIVKEQGHDANLKKADRLNNFKRVRAKLPSSGPNYAAHVANIKRRTREHPLGKPFRKLGKHVKRYVYDDRLKKVVCVNP